MDTYYSHHIPSHTLAIITERKGVRFNIGHFLSPLSCEDAALYTAYKFALGICKTTGFLESQSEIKMIVYAKVRSVILGADSSYEVTYFFRKSGGEYQSWKDFKSSFHAVFYHAPNQPSITILKELEKPEWLECSPIEQLFSAPTKGPNADNFKTIAKLTNPQWLCCYVSPEEKLCAYQAVKKTSLSLRDIPVLRLPWIVSLVSAFSGYSEEDLNLRLARGTRRMSAKLPIMFPDFNGPVKIERVDPEVVGSSFFSLIS